MSYCRIGQDSDVYLYASGVGFSFHFGLPDAGGNFHFHTDNAADALGKLYEVRNSGMSVPQYAIDRLKAEVTAAEVVNRHDPPLQTPS